MPVGELVHPGRKPGFIASKILLISANRCIAPDPVFPLGLACLDAALRRAGHQTRWVDLLANEAQLIDILESFRPEFVGISLRNIDDVLIRTKETFFNAASTLTETIRKISKAPIILGGSGFSIFPGELLELTHADFGIAGSGESSLLSLIEALNNGGGYQDIPGLAYSDHGKTVVNAPSTGCRDEALSCGDWPDVITSYYMRSTGMLNLQTQRGCGFRCCYCTYPVIEGKKHSRRPPEMVAEEFEQIQRLGAKHIFITDSVFNSSARHVSEICEAILRRNVKMAWGCFLRPQGLTQDLMALMARAGLSHIEFGSDSFCDEVLATYEKDFTFDDILHSCELAKRENIDCCHFFIAGGPGETMETLEASFENARQFKQPVIIAVAGMRIYPGTRLFERAVAEGAIRGDANLLAPAYYLAPGLNQESVFTKLNSFGRLSPGWITGETDASYRELVRRFRDRGVKGPLWSYFAMMQRIWPMGSDKVATP
jgi:radical SAM superfamily enzyme YgiQ (UPF0313 family)